MTNQSENRILPSPPGQKHFELQPDRSRLWLRQPDGEMASGPATRGQVAEPPQSRQPKHNVARSKELWMDRVLEFGPAAGPDRLCTYRNGKHRSQIGVGREGSRQLGENYKLSTRLGFIGHRTGLPVDRAGVHLFRSFDIAAFTWIDANAIAFVDEWWYLNRDAVFQGRGLVNI